MDERLREARKTWTPETLWKLDDYAKQVMGSRYDPDGTAQRVGPTVEGDDSDDDLL